MARLKSIGFELNSTTSDVETTNNSGGVISSATFRSGAYSFNKANGSTSANMRVAYASSDYTGAIYSRFYFRIQTATSALQRIWTLQTSGVTRRVSIRVNANRTLELWDESNVAQIGSDSSALALDTWYSVELLVDTTTLASSVVEARIDGSSFASGTVNLAGGGSEFTNGFGASDSGCRLFWDDIAINDTSGSFQNSWPGEGSIVHLRPNATGDNDAWQDGAGGSSNYQSIDEVTPNDASGSDYIASNSSGQIVDANIDATPAAIGASDTINVVQVGVRIASAFNSNSNSLVLRVKAAASGTVEESSTITTASTTWTTNSASVPRNYQLTLYDLPGASTTAWTKSDLDSAQIGARSTTPLGAGIRVSTIWMLVDYTSAPASTDVTVEPTVLTATWSLEEPTVTAIKSPTITPSVQTATFSLQSPTVSGTRNPTITPTVLTATFSIQGPSVALGVTNSPSVQTATFSVLSPTVSGVRNPTVTPSVQTVTSSVQSPTVSGVRNPVIAPTVQTATFALQAPTVTAGVGVSPSVQTATFTLNSPTVTTTRNPTVTPSVQTATFSVESPTIDTTRSTTVTPTVLTATFSLEAPTIRTNDVTIRPAVQTASFVLNAPTVTTTKNPTITVSVQGMTFTLNAPSYVLWNPGWTDGSAPETSWSAASPSSATWTDVTRPETAWTD